MELIFVLVRSARGVNIGAAARAMHTMGFGRLRLVRPGADAKAAAYHVAHGSTHLLDQAQQFESLEEAVADCDLVVGSTARRRGVRHDYLSPAQLRRFVGAQAATTARCALVFGSEESGLNNEEIGVCHVLTTIAMRQEYPSLNLGQAVMVYAYELGSPEAEPADVTAAAPQSVRVLLQRLEQLLTILCFDPNRALYRRIMERAALLSGTDLNLAHSLLSALLSRLQH